VEGIGGSVEEGVRGRESVGDRQRRCPPGSGRSAISVGHYKRGPGRGADGCTGACSSGGGVFQ
jgi:hypothetical protein